MTLARRASWCALLLVLALHSAAAARRKRDREEDVASRFWGVIFWTYAAVFLPAIVYFVYSIVRDPMTPVLLRVMARRGVRRVRELLGATYPAALSDDPSEVEADSDADLASAPLGRSEGTRRRARAPMRGAAETDEQLLARLAGGAYAAEDERSAAMRT